MECTKLELSKFWINIKNEYSSLSKRALLFSFLLQLGTYLCETGFSAMLRIKRTSYVLQ